MVKIFENINKYKNKMVILKSLDKLDNEKQEYLSVCNIKNKEERFSYIYDLICDHLNNEINIKNLVLV